MRLHGSVMKYPFAVRANDASELQSDKERGQRQVGDFHSDALLQHMEKQHRCRSYIKDHRGHDLHGPSRSLVALQKPLGNLDLLTKVPGLGARGGLAATRSGDNVVPAGRGLQGLPGRHINDNPGDRFPQASRGIAHGGVAKWSFERMPSLLQAPLHRDTCKRGAAGNPPSTLPQPPDPPAYLDPHYQRRTLSIPPQPTFEYSDEHGGELVTQRSAGSVTGRSSGPGSDTGRSPAAAELRRSIANQSQPELRRPPKAYGVSGVSWDDAAVTAGGSIRGSDGRFLGQ